MPIIRGIGPADVEEMQKALREAGDGKLLAFCRSGGGRRSSARSLSARRGLRDEVVGRLSPAGFDPGPISHLL